jgi:hypothetical protein
MAEHGDLNLRPAPGNDDAIEPIDVTPPNRPTGPVIAIALVVVAAGFALYLVFGRQTSAPVSDQPAAPAAAAERGPAPLGGAAEAVTVPPLDASDPVVRELVSKLSSHPRIAAWLTTDGLIRNFAVVVANISEGRSPASHLRTIAPSGPFRVATQNRVLFIDSRSYQRYDALADAILSLDAAGSARLYATLKPRIEEAAAELGYGEGSFDRMLEKAIVSLLSTPVPPGELAVHPRGGVVYAYADEDLEAMTSAQKHLLRMGPRNARLLKDKLRDIALALGIPEERLPK